MRYEFDSIAAIPPPFWTWAPYMTPQEWACKGSGKIVVDTDFLNLYKKLRLMYARPLIILSGYRSPEHDADVGKSSQPGSGPHTTARAFDVQIYGAHLYELVGLAQQLGFTGFGFNQKLGSAPASRSLHLDNLTAPDFSRPTIWNY